MAGNTKSNGRLFVAPPNLTHTQKEKERESEKNHIKSLKAKIGVRKEPYLNGKYFACAH